MATSQKTTLKSMKSKTMTIELPFFNDVRLNEEHEEVDEYKLHAEIIATTGIRPLQTGVLL